MDLRQLAALIAVSEHGSFSSAAKALYTVQSNVSAHIARLERELGVTLVDRARGMLTEEGLLAVARARSIQHELDALRADIASLGTEVSGETRVGIIGTTARWLVPILLEAMAGRHPSVRVVLVEASTSSLVPQLLANQLDLAVVNLPIDDPDITGEPLFDEELVLLVRSDHALGRRDEIRFEELDAQPLVLPAPGTILRDDLEADAGRAGVRLEPLAEIDGVRLLTALTFGGFGPTIVPATAVAGPLRPGFRRVRVLGMAPRRVGLAHRRRGLLPAPARAVSDVLIEVINRAGPGQPGVHLVAQPR